MSKENGKMTTKERSQHRSPLPSLERDSPKLEGLAAAVISESLRYDIDKRLPRMLAQFEADVEALAALSTQDVWAKEG